MKNLKSIVIGPTEHTRTCLEEILATPGFTVDAVFASDTSWRHKKARWTTFDDLAKQHGFRLFYCDRIKNPKYIGAMKEINPDVIFEFGASEMIPKEILHIPKYGCIGSHGGPLPEYRGGSSMNWALLMDKKEWGVTLYYLAEKADDGDIIGVGRFAIDDRDDIQTVHDKSDYHIKMMLRKSLADLRDKGTTDRIKQYGGGTFLQQRKPGDGIIDWNKSPREIFNFVRAQTHPFPGAFSYVSDGAGNKSRVYVWKATYTDFAHPNLMDKGILENGACLGVDVYPGRGLKVKCEGGEVEIQRIGTADGLEMWGDDFYYANRLSHASRFTADK